MFEPSPQELAKAGDLLSSLLLEGRQLMREQGPRDHQSKLERQREESAARSLAAAQRIMERLQWRPRASVIMLTLTHCVHCGSETQTFSNFAVAMYRNSDKAERYVTTPMLDPAWPQETHFIETSAPACMECIGDFGVEFESAEPVPETNHEEIPDGTEQAA